MIKRLTFFSFLVFGFFFILISCSTALPKDEDYNIKYFASRTCPIDLFKFNYKCEYTNQIEKSELKKLKVYYEVLYAKKDGSLFGSDKYIKVNLDKSFPENIFAEKGKPIIYESISFNPDGRIWRYEINPYQKPNFLKRELWIFEYSDHTLKKIILTDFPSEQYSKIYIYKNNLLSKVFLYKFDEIDRLIGYTTFDHKKGLMKIFTKADKLIETNYISKYYD